jgi:hypothetical protein
MRKRLISKPYTDLQAIEWEMGNAKKRHKAFLAELGLAPLPWSRERNDRGNRLAY